MSALNIAITSGDADGIGTEVVAKALKRLGPQRGVQFLLWRSPKMPLSHLKMIDSKFDRLTMENPPETTVPALKSTQILDICSGTSPAEWVEAAGHMCLSRAAHAVATAPLSKTEIQRAGFDERGHTGILARISNTKQVRMFFVGKHFSVLLHTDHCPLQQVPEKIFTVDISETIRLAKVARHELLKNSRKPVGVLGLNPHAGEHGLLGNEELALKKAIQDADVHGPLVPDSAFHKKNWSKYSLFVALYHDQGLIPFKLIHGHTSGVHLTLGLPFIRTSVDHGCAKDIFNQNRANPASMIEAIRAAISLARKETKLC